MITETGEFKSVIIRAWFTNAGDADDRVKKEESRGHASYCVQLPDGSYEVRTHI